MSSAGGITVDYVPMYMAHNHHGIGDLSSSRIQPWSLQLLACSEVGDGPKHVLYYRGPLMVMKRSTPCLVEGCWVKLGTVMLGNSASSISYETEMASKRIREIARSPGAVSATRAAHVG